MKIRMTLLRHAISKIIRAVRPVRKLIESKTAISNDVVANTLIRKTAHGVLNVSGSQCQTSTD